MITHDVTATAEPIGSNTVAVTIDAFIELQRTNRGTELADVLSEDAVLDLNVPQWRFQVGGNLAISAAFAQSYPDGFRTTGSRWEPSPTGAIVEYDGWDVARNVYYRHLAWLKLDGPQISRMTIYCTGEWDPETLERQRREAPMVDTEPTGDES